MILRYLTRFRAVTCEICKVPSFGDPERVEWHQLINKVHTHLVCDEVVIAPLDVETWWCPTCYDKSYDNELGEVLRRRAIREGIPDVDVDPEA